MSYEVPSSEEVKKEQQYAGTPFEAGNYIAKIAKIELLFLPTWDNTRKTWNYASKEWKYSIISLPCVMESGDPMADINSKAIEPLASWVKKEFNPFALGTLQDGSPSFTRAFLAYMSGMSVNERLAPPDFVLFSPDGKIVVDQAIREKFVAESSLDLDKRTLIGAGYKHCPDLRSFEGKYLGVNLTTKPNSSYNNIARFNKLPMSFKQPQEDPEVMKKFEEGYQKMLAKRKEKAQSVDGNSGTESNAGEVKQEQVAF